MARVRRRRWPGLIIGLVVFGALLWVAYWYLAQMATERAIARLNAGPIGSRQVACDEPVIGRSFLQIDVRCRRVTYAGDNGRIAGEVGGVAAQAPLYWPGSVNARLDAPLRANAPALGIALTANWSAANTTASAGFGGIRGASAEFLSLAIDNAGTIARLPVKGATADRAMASFEPAGGGAYTLTASTTQLTLVKSDGAGYPAIDASGRVTAEGVGALGTDPVAAVRAWLTRGGSVAIERFRIAAAGAVIAGNGKLTLAPTGLLSGSILIRFNSIEALGNLIETLKPGSREKLDLALQGLNAMSAPARGDDGSEMRQTTITLTDGLAWVAVVPLGVVPAIRF